MVLFMTMNIVMAKMAQKLLFRAKLISLFQMANCLCLVITAKVHIRGILAMVLALFLIAELSGQFSSGYSHSIEYVASNRIKKTCFLSERSGPHVPSGRRVPRGDMAKSYSLRKQLFDSLDIPDHFYWLGFRKLLYVAELAFDLTWGDFGGFDFVGWFLEFLLNTV